jgi:hypothetical protein
MLSPEGFARGFLAVVGSAQRKYSLGGSSQIVPEAKCAFCARCSRDHLPHPETKMMWSRSSEHAAALPVTCGETETRANAPR